jgi:hypothetical protein
MAETMERAPVVSPGGVYLGHATVARFDPGPHDRTIQRIARGLYFHEFRNSLPPDCPIEAMIINATDPDWGNQFQWVLRMMEVRSIGGEAVFEYAFVRLPESPETSLWLFRFYEGHVAYASTGRLAYTDTIQSPGHC